MVLVVARVGFHPRRKRRPAYLDKLDSYLQCFQAGQYSRYMPHEGKHDVDGCW